MRSIFGVTVNGVNGVDIPIPNVITGGSGDFTTLLNLVYSIAGIVAVIGVILGGILYATSDADSGKIQRAKNSIVYSIVGLIFVMLAAAITNFVLGRF